MIDLSTVYKIAGLARLELSEARAQQMARELSNILAHVDAIRMAPVEDQTAAEPSHQSASMRSDDVQPSLSIDVVMQLAPDSAGRHFRVARVLGE